MNIESTAPAIYGITAEFENEAALITAAEKAHEAGYTKMDAYTPHPVHGLTEALGRTPTRLPFIVFLGGCVGLLAGYGLQYYCEVIDYPTNIGGRPFHSWPSFIPPTFEVTVLFSAFAAVFGMLALNGLPRPYHPIFNAPNFAAASTDRFFLCIEAIDPQFDVEQTLSFMEGLGAVAVSEVSN